MCGEHNGRPSAVTLVSGSSPHVRGAQNHRRRCEYGGGIIPACAGSTSTRSWHRLRPGDHPRMCGEHLLCCVIVFSFAGSSPHVRGAHRAGARLAAVPGIIPACAGSTDIITQKNSRHRDHPRMYGEHSMALYRHPSIVGSSPHVRGARLSLRAGRGYHGIIPACAGSTL